MAWSITPHEVACIFVHMPVTAFGPAHRCATGGSGCPARHRCNACPHTRAAGCPSTGYAWAHAPADGSVRGACRPAGWGQQFMLIDRHAQQMTATVGQPADLVPVRTSGGGTQVEGVVLVLPHRDHRGAGGQVVLLSRTRLPASSCNHCSLLAALMTWTSLPS